MSEQAALAFRKLVASMRTLEKQYWARRDKGVLRQSIELEKRVDETIMKVEPKNVPETDNGNFFILVAELRVATKQYFSEKKKPDPDKELVKTLFNTIKEKEAKIDKQLIHFQEEDFRKQGYTIQYHVMERPYKCPPHSLFQSTDEQLANVMFNDYLRHPSSGTMIFMMKKYIGKDGKPLSDEEIDKLTYNKEKSAQNVAAKVNKAIAEKIIGTGNYQSLRSRSSTWFECKVRYQKTQEDGSEKITTEHYTVDALSFTEAEAKIIEEMAVYVSGELRVDNINRAAYGEIFFSDISDDDLWFKARLAFITIDEKSEKEKRSYVTYLVQAKSLERARRYIDEVMGKTMIDYEVKSLSETKIMDVFEHKSSSDEKKDEKSEK